MNPRPAPQDIQLVTFFLQDEEYAVDVMAVREIASMMEITKISNSPHYVEGVISLRGNVIPIISLRSRFGLPQAAEPAASCIAVMDFANQLTGFVIDEISDVIRIRRSEILPSTDFTTDPWIAGVLNMDQRLVLVVNLELLAKE